MKIQDLSRNLCVRLNSTSFIKLDVMKYLPSLLKWLIPPFSHRIFLYSATCTPDKRRSSIFYSSETHRMTSHRSGILSSLKTLLVLACVGSSKCPV